MMDSMVKNQALHGGRHMDAAADAVEYAVNNVRYPLDMLRIRLNPGGIAESLEKLRMPADSESTDGRGREAR